MFCLEFERLAVRGFEELCLAVIAAVARVGPVLGSIHLERVHFDHLCAHRLGETAGFLEFPFRVALGYRRQSECSVAKRVDSNLQQEGTSTPPE